MKTSLLHIYSIGYTSQDVVRNNHYVEVTPTEILSSVQGDSSEVAEDNITIKSKNGETNNIVSSKKTTIRAKWMNLGDPNRVNPPEIGKGSQVIILRVGNTNQYYWIPNGNELDLKKRESVVKVYSNKATIKDKALLNKVYYSVIDTINKVVKFHTDNNDGEKTTYDLEINTKDGIVTFTDGNGNSYELSSENGDIVINSNGSITQTIGNGRTLTITGDDGLTIDGNSTLTVSGDSTEDITGNKTINFKGLALSNGTDELIALLVDLLAAMLEEKHIGNLGAPTALDPATIQAYTDLKTKLEAFMV